MSAMGFIRPEEWVPSGVDSLESGAMEAVRSKGNTLVTAGPGAGKTELLGQRGVFLLQTGACLYPRRILAISFKRDAARNLRDRFQRRCNKEQAGRLDSMTFDAFAKVLLDRFWRALPEPWALPKPYVLGRLPTRNEFQDLQRTTSNNLDDSSQPAGWSVLACGKKPTPAQIQGVSLDSFYLAIHELTLHPLNVPHVAAFLQLVEFRRSFGQGNVQLTFPMIGRLAQLIIEANPKIRSAILATYSHLFMDEFQDTTGVQYGLMKSIFADSDTVITAVGDDKQKIMGWAGAQKDSFGLFKTDFLRQGESIGQRHITLSTNYRSNARIVDILNTLKRRLAPSEPDFKAARAAPALPPEQICSIIVSQTAKSEAEALGAFLSTELKLGASPRNFGLLVRQKAADWENTLAPVFKNYGISLRNEDRDVGGATIQDLMTETYSQTVIDCLELLTRNRGGPLWIRVLETLSEMAGLNSEEEADRIQVIVEELDAFHKQHKIENSDSIAKPEEILKLLAAVEAFFGLGPLKASSPQYQQGDFFERVRNATKSFLAENAAGESTWPSVIAKYRGENQIPLMTITKSKGLEYDVVILLGLEDEQWWSFNNNPDEGHSTFFVAASRARERLFLTIRQGQRTSKIKEIYDLLGEAGVKVQASEDWIMHKQFK